MKRCNCGGVMEGVELLFFPKKYKCFSCGGTLEVKENGIQRWYDADGNMGTYMPLNKNNKE